MIPPHLHFLLALLLVFCTLPSVHPTTCAADFEPCGTAVLAPLKHLSCCSEGFYCFTKGPYFSQCRPREELSKSRQSLPLPLSSTQQQHRPLCGLDYGVCAAGIAAHSSLVCCNPTFECTPVPPLYWQCLPHQRKPLVYWRWSRLNVAGRIMFTYTSHPVGTPVAAADKIDPRLWHPSHRCVAAVLPRLGSRRPLFELHLRSSLAFPLRIKYDGTGARVCGENATDLALTLAAFPQVLRLHVVV